MGNSKCIHCSALDPWDETHLKDNKIKHTSFHSYLRKLTSGVDKVRCLISNYVFLERKLIRMKILWSGWSILSFSFNYKKF